MFDVNYAKVRLVVQTLGLTAINNDIFYVCFIDRRVKGKFPGVWIVYQILEDPMAYCLHSI